MEEFIKIFALPILKDAVNVDIPSVYCELGGALATSGKMNEPSGLL